MKPHIESVSDIHYPMHIPEPYIKTILYNGIDLVRIYVTIRSACA